MTNEEYHAHPALGASNIKDILANPYAFAAGIKRQQTDAMIIGSAVHALVLEPLEFTKQFAIMPDFNGRTNEGKAAKAAFELDCAGKTIIKQADYELACLCAGAIREQAAPYLVGGVAEQAFFSEIDGVPVKCKPDYYIEELGLIVDLKVVTDASPDGFIKQVANFGYYIQEAHYTDVLTSLGKPVNNFLFIAVEKTAPHMVGLYELDYVARDFGRAEIRRGLDIYRRLDQFARPIYTDTADGTAVQTLSLPNYVFYKKGASL